MTMTAPSEKTLDPPQRGSARSVGLVASGLGVIAVIALVAPRVGPIGAGTLIALVVAVLATRSALKGNRDTRL